MMIETPRLRLRLWQDRDRDAFADLHADPAVMQDQGGPIDRTASDAKLDRYRALYNSHRICRLAVETRTGDFLGYAGVTQVDEPHPLGAHFEIGWRLKRNAWGFGYASEAADAALRDALQRLALREVLAYTSEDNLRSQAVMARLRLERNPARDFTAEYEGYGLWRGLVWVARPPAVTK
jgi:RimJ/RimL family protein N-acetyltransferase